MHKDILSVQQLFSSILDIYPDEKQITPIIGGLTNNNYVVECNNQKFFVRLACSNPEILGINRSKEYFFHQQAVKVNAVPSFIHYEATTGTMILPFISGSLYGKYGTWHQDKYQAITNVIKLMKQYHKIVPQDQTSTPFGLNIIYQYFVGLRCRNVSCPENINDTIATIEKMKFPKTPLVMCHHDLCFHNMIHDGEKLWLVDWEYADWNDPMYDLACLCLEQRYDEQEKKLALKYYYGELNEEIENNFQHMMTLGLLRTALWGFLQNEIAKVHPFDYKTLANEYYQKFWHEVKQLGY